jgi:hypothetical protein
VPKASRDERAAASARTKKKSTYSILTDFNKFLLIGHGDYRLTAGKKAAKRREGGEKSKEEKKKEKKSWATAGGNFNSVAGGLLCQSALDLKQP